MGDNKKEIRNTTGEVITEVESRTVEGYAILYNRSSDGLSFEEVILPGSLDGVVQRSDVFALLNHDQNRGILARAKNGQGSLELCVDAKGLKYRLEAPTTAMGDEVVENLLSGERNEISLCFVVGEGIWEMKEEGTWERNISRMEELGDLAAGDKPA